MNRKLFFTDKIALQGLDNNLSATLPVMQEVCNQFAVIGIQITNVKQITDLLDNKRNLLPGQPDSFVFDQLYPTTPAGFNRERFKQFAEMPDLNDVTKALARLHDFFPAPGSPSDHIFWDCFLINSGQVEISGAALEKQRDRFRSYATTQEQETRLKLVQSLCDALNAVFAAGSNMSHMDIKLPKIATWDETGGKYIPAAEFVLSGSNYQKFML